MKPDPELLAAFAAKIAETEDVLEQLETEIAEIGMPAAAHLEDRLAALKIEENALKRNFEEVQAGADVDLERLAKIDLLIHHIRNEESSMEHEADFLQMAAPSSVILAAKAGVQFIDFLKRSKDRILGGRHPLGSSVFVNHTHDDLVQHYGLQENKDEK